MALPRVIFFDAVGTLFGIQGTVGSLYSQLALQAGVEVSATALDQAFRKSFGLSPSPAFPQLKASEIPQHEYKWWRGVAVETFRQAGVLEQFADFDRFFEALYHYFSTPDAWVLYPDVLPILEQCRSQDIQLGVLSNFDSRLHTVLEVLGLAKFFNSITISTQVGAAKPDPKIFMIALQAHHCPAEAAWHIGDSYRDDYEGAKSIGIKSIWLKRQEEAMPTRAQTANVKPSTSISSISSLTEISSWLSGS